MTALMTSPAVALLVKATLLLALGLLVATRIRRSAHELRHMVLLATIGATLALPFALIAAPHWDAPLLPSEGTVPATISTSVEDSDLAPTSSVIAPARVVIAPQASSPTASVARLALGQPSRHPRGDLARRIVGRDSPARRRLFPAASHHAARMAASIHRVDGAPGLRACSRARREERRPAREPRCEHSAHLGFARRCHSPA